MRENPKATRRSPVYGDVNLRQILQILFAHVHNPTREELFTFFDKLLTNWEPRHIPLPDDQRPEDDTRAKREIQSLDAPVESGLERHVLYEYALAIWHSLTANERRYLHAKTWKVSDDSIHDTVLFDSDDAIAENVQFHRGGDDGPLRSYSRAWVHGLRQQFQDKVQRQLAELEIDADERTTVLLDLYAIASHHEM